MPPGTTFGSPQELTTLPSGSNSITGGAGLAISFSAFVRLVGSAVRLTMNTWSLASTQVPPTFPVTQSSGSGLGQKGATSNFTGVIDLPRRTLTSGEKKFTNAKAILHAVAIESKWTTLFASIEFSFFKQNKKFCARHSAVKL